jgi:hypothetical protein
LGFWLSLVVIFFHGGFVESKSSLSLLEKTFMGSGKDSKKTRKSDYRLWNIDKSQENGVVQIRVTVFPGSEGIKSLGGVEASGFIWDTRRP